MFTKIFFFSNKAYQSSQVDKYSRYIVCLFVFLSLSNIISITEAKVPDGGHLARTALVEGCE